MAEGGDFWYFSNMTHPDAIPAFGLYGEQGPFPDVLHVEDFAARAPSHDWRILPHRHDLMAQLFVLDHGRAEARTDGVRHLLTSGDFLYIPERCVHDITFDPGPEGTVVSFPTSLGTAAERSATRAAPSAPLRGGITPGLSQHVTLLREAATGHSAFRAQRVVGLAQSVLALLAEFPKDSHATSPPSQRLSRLQELITTHMAEGWTAAQYARALSLSTGHLSRLCRAATGQSAASFIEQRVIEEACRLLAFTQLPVSEVGYRLGHLDPSYFSKRFRRAMGQTPSAYRAMFTRTDMATPPDSAKPAGAGGQA